MIYGYVRVSTTDQSIESQKNAISRYLVERQWQIHQWIEVQLSSRKSESERKIHELLDLLQPHDTVIVSELSRLGRSIKDVLNLIEKIIKERQCRLILLKQNLDLNPVNQNDMTNKILLTVFSMVAELERDFISERTKEGLRARKAKGIILGKPKGTIQKSMYDKDSERIAHLHSLGVPLQTIIDKHLQYGQYRSLKRYVEKEIKHIQISKT